ncbi:MAG: hypothetical protein HY667_01225 [Chloroflexi bacterium]|nr:hypothetical protein [Chloroflexota bacterium]
MSGQYEVLSPWAEADPVPPKGISPRLTDLAGKKIGLFANGKRASRPILTVVEKKLRQRYPTAEISWYMSRLSEAADIELVGKVASFEEWIKGVDAVILAVGD